MTGIIVIIVIILIIIIIISNSEKAAIQIKYEELYSDAKKLRQWIAKMEAEGT